MRYEEQAIHTMTKHAHENNDKAHPQHNQSAPQSKDPDFRSWVNHPKNVARLQILVIVLGIFVVLGFATVIARIAYLTLYQPEGQNSAVLSGASTSAPVAVPPANAAIEQIIELPPGAVVEDIQPMKDGTVMVRFQDTRGTGMMVIDANSGAVLKKWRFAPGAN